jgi:hypothetical protein
MKMVKQLSVNAFNDLCLNYKLGRLSRSFSARSSFALVINPDCLHGHPLVMDNLKMLMLSKRVT